MATRLAVVNKAASYDGTVETPLGSNYIFFNDWYYGSHTKGPWCAAFVSYVLHHCGVPVGPGPKGTTYTPAWKTWAEQEGLWVPNTAAVDAGWITLYYWTNMGRIAHCGITAEPSEAGQPVKVWEGNTDKAGGRTGGRVLLQTRSRSTINPHGGFVNLDRYYSIVTPPTPSIQEDDMAYTPGNSINVTPVAPDSATQAFISGDGEADVRWVVGLFPWNKPGGGWTEGPTVEHKPSGGWIIGLSLPAAEPGRKRVLSLTSDVPVAYTFA